LSAVTSFAAEPAIADEEKVWVVVKQVQCLDNSRGEKDWLQKNHTTAYPLPGRARKIMKDLLCQPTE